MRPAPRGAPRAVARAGGGPTRRQVLAAFLLAPVALAGTGACSLSGARQPEAPDPLVALAEQARADAALAAAAVGAASAPAGRIEQLRAARAAHAGALAAEVARLDPAAVPVAATGSPTQAQPVTQAQLRDAVLASSRDAAEVALGLPAERVGLVASVAACCAAYAAVLA